MAHQASQSQESDDSDWDVTNHEEDVFSANGSDSDSIATNSTLSDHEAPEPNSPKKKMKKPKATTKPKSKPDSRPPKPKPSGKLKAAAAAEAEEKAAKRAKPKIKVLAQPKTAAQPPADPVQPAELPRVVKYSHVSSSGIVGRPLKNSKVVVPHMHEPSEYPSVQAYRDDPPTSPRQFVRVHVPGRKQASYRAFCVKELAPPNTVTYFILASAKNDSDALAGLGLSQETMRGPIGTTLAKAAQMQHKNNHAAAHETMLKVPEDVRKTLGWQPDADADKQPAIMGPELSEQLLATPQPEASKKRPPPEEQDLGNAKKKFVSELQDIVGAPISTVNVSFTVTLPPP